MVLAVFLQRPMVFLFYEVVRFLQIYRKFEGERLGTDILLKADLLMKIQFLLNFLNSLLPVGGVFNYRSTDGKDLELYYVSN